MALNIVSYIAQFCNLRRNKGNTHTTPLYLAYNILSAAEQANLCHWFSGDVAKKSQSPGDPFAQRSRQWMTLSQMATIWLVFSFMQ